MKRILNLLLILSGLALVVYLAITFSGDEIVKSNPVLDTEPQEPVAFELDSAIVDPDPITKPNPNAGKKKEVLGRINTYVDGYDVKKVKLWSSTTGTRYPNCYLTNGVRVRVLSKGSDYWLVQDVTNSACTGYCMPGFVRLD